MNSSSQSSGSTSSASAPRVESFDSDLETQLRYLVPPQHDQHQDEFASSPLLTVPALKTCPDIQHGLIGVSSVSSKKLNGSESRADILSARVFQNVTAPASTFICGSQGAGKSNTLACLLENCLLRSKLGSLPRPLTGIVFHYDGFNSDLIGLPCEAAFLASDRQQRKEMYADDDNSKKTYARVPNVVIEPFRLRDEDLNTQRMLNLMAVGAGNVPLYMHVVTRILREMRISQQNSGQPFKYSQFKATMNKEDLQVAQSVPLQQRLDTLESFMASSAILSKKQKKAMKTTEANNWTPCPSQLIIVDLSCPCVTSDMACSLFNIALQLFLEGDKSVSRVVALDEAHKYMRDSSPESCIFTENLLGVIRQQRHLGTRVIISTQEPTISPKLLDLCSVTIVHRFTSPDWLRTLQKHLAGVSSLVPAENEGTEAKKNHGRPGVHPITVRGRDPAAELFSLIVNLCTGQALVFSPSSIIGSKDLDRGCTGGNKGVKIDDTDSSDDSSSGNDSSEDSDRTLEAAERLSHRVLRVNIRARLTSDGGRSVMAL
ncbi:uncharacterized protein VDAG_02140 [Verticillium dahliae VdLs.17]|uniref:Zona occludens toxin N-terminal domain-containing protein n=1 Tax=Verticillium dahliae (strain VdLs.17 / ATCC MYA-4575 / FGSC 10137) TaxID=498257 RepID=G2WUZ9_VERDV|nr:uncharacterized protein VDAG_02140 [Verticillium dahliae VdLs.17]EGY20124.1 hypothetical protein VDAG_02140 [Verticillium dahliae VdLs.17]KAF3349908.1 hypothetical protein VdG2_01723 [Verticillium dahliae VDG2]